MHRVAITGIGVVSACGLRRDEFWQRLCAGKSAIAPIESVDCSRLRFRNGAEVRGFDPELHFEASQLALLDRFAQFTIVAAKEAIEDSGVAFTPELRQRTAVVTGTSLGGQITQERACEGYYKEGSRVHPLSIPRTMANAGASHVSMVLKLSGPAYTISTACSSSAHAIGQAFRMVRSGEADLALTGGGEAPFAPGHLAAWDSMRVVSNDTCRPFCLERSGLILGEGAAMLVLEPLDGAIARDARIYAEVAGLGMTSDSHHITQPSADGASRAICAALVDAGAQPQDVGYINAHGTGTLANDVTETAAIRNVFGSRTDRLPVSATKSIHGHALGASGALEAAATALALANRVLPPTANFLTPDPKCKLDIVAGSARPVAVRLALSNSFAFGGLNAVLAFRAPP
jgi:nodulation protein E